MQFKNNLSFAKAADRRDPLRKFRAEFLLPKKGNKKLIYFNGNSLGLQPKQTKKFIDYRFDNQEIIDYCENLIVNPPEYPKTEIHNIDVDNECFSQLRAI